MALGLVSVMIAARLRSYGVGKRRVAMLIVELWAVFVLWVGVLWAAASRLVPEGGLGSGADLAEFSRRFGEFSPADRVFTVASIVLGLALFVHFSWALRAAMRVRSADDES